MLDNFLTSADDRDVVLQKGAGNAIKKTCEELEE